MKDLNKEMGSKAFEKLCNDLFPDGPNHGAMARVSGAIWPH